MIGRTDFEKPTPRKLPEMSEQSVVSVIQYFFLVFVTSVNLDDSSGALLFQSPGFYSIQKLIGFCFWISMDAGFEVKYWIAFLLIECHNILAPGKRAKGLI